MMPIHIRSVINDPISRKLYNKEEKKGEKKLLRIHLNIKRITESGSIQLTQFSSQLFIIPTFEEDAKNTKKTRFICLSFMGPYDYNKKRNRFLMIPRQAKSTVWIRNQIGYFSDNQSFYYLFNVFLERIFFSLFCFVTALKMNFPFE